jgi:alpha-beta hydrolase superfamily lysophospholipase
VWLVESTELWASSRQTALRMVAYDGAGAGGPSVVALHGMVTGVDVLRETVPGLDPYARLAAEGLNVLALDWPGHGRSGGARGHLTYRLAIEATATAVESCQQRWGGPVGAFGTALGGVLAFYAGLESDQIQALVCHNVCDLRDVRPLLQRTRQGMLMPLAGRVSPWLSRELQGGIPVPAAGVVASGDLAEDPRLVRALRRHPLAVWRYDLASLSSIFVSPGDKPAIAAQRTPTLAAVGSHDRVLPQTHTRAFVSALPGDAELMVLSGAGHQLVLEHPEGLLPAAADFFTRQLAQSR